MGLARHHRLSYGSENGDQTPATIVMQSLNDLSPGKFLGRYELLMPVAQGGMAAVWAARLVGTRGFQRVVAIKTILPTLSDDARFEQMFLDEAGLAARVRHPNVVQVLDLGEDNGLLYQVMEWIDGEALSSFLRDPKAIDGLPHAIAARIMIGVCEGLHAAHETRDEADQVVGLVHRDVSPQNTLVTRDGVPKVVDFGVAKASSLSSARTVAGTLKGKPAYMAPEQIQGGEVDRRADIFSLGVLLYMSTTGHNPFRGANDMATLHLICSKDEAPPPSALRKDYPAELEEVVMRAITKDRLRRFPTAAAMARAIEQAVPEVRKTGDSEVAEFMRSFLSSRLEARGTALRQALLSADQRASIPGSPQSTLRGLGQAGPPRAVISDRPAAERMSTSTLIGGTGVPDIAPGDEVPTVSVDMSNPTLDAQTMPRRPASRTGLWVGLAVAVVAGMALTAGGVFWLVRSRGTPSEPFAAASTQPADTAAPPSSETPPEPTTDASAAISPEALPTAADIAQRPPPGATTQDAGTVPTTDPPATTQPTPTGTAPAAASSTGSRIRGTVPSIRDPGF